MDASPDSLIKVYDQLCQSYRAIDDFRAKLLGFLPLSSAGGAFLLLNGVLVNSGNVAKRFLAPAGVFGFVITLGLFFYEIYGIRKCHALIEAGKYLECSLGITHGQFRRRPRSVRGFIDEVFAAGVIYPAVLAGWIFLTLVFARPDQPPAIGVALGAAICIFIIGFLIMCKYNGALPLQPKELVNPKDCE